MHNPLSLKAFPPTMVSTMTPAQRQQRQLAPIKTGLYVKAESGLQLRSRKVRLV